MPINIKNLRVSDCRKIKYNNISKKQSIIWDKAFLHRTITIAADPMGVPAYLVFQLSFNNMKRKFYDEL